MPAYKNEKLGTWYCKFYYTDWNGEKKQKMKKGFKREKDAKAYERDFLSKAHASCNMTFKNLVELYFEHCKSRLKPTTLDNKKYVIDLKILPYFENMPINTIDQNTVSKWQNELLNSEENYTQTYLRTINNQLSAIFNYAIKYYKLPSNPARICGAMGKNKAETMLFWTKEEFDQFMAIVSDKPLSKVVFNLFFYTGLRCGELLALTYKDFDIENKTVNINKSYARLNREDIIQEPKTPKSKRIITLPQFICEIVQEYKNQLYDYRSNERLFHVTKYYLHHEMDRGCRKSGVKRIRIHDLRHSHASLLIDMGIAPLLISERLGHENIETTLQTYSHLYPNKHSEVADKLQQLNIPIDTPKQDE